MLTLFCTLYAFWVVLCGLAERSATVWSKTPAVLFMIPRDLFVALREQEQHTGDLVDDIAFLNTMPWLSWLSAEDMMRLAQEAKKVVVPRGKVIVEEGSSALCCV